MKAIKVALAPIARSHFDLAMAEQVARSFRTNLIFHGLKVLGSGALITNLEQARKLAAELEGQEFDLLLVCQTTFTDSTLLFTLVEACQKPVFLWGVPEEPSGDRLKLASLSGLNLATHALTNAHIPYEFVYAPVNDQAGLQKIISTGEANRVKLRLQHARIGVVGQPPDGMDSCWMDESALRDKLGVTTVRIELKQVLERVQGLDVSQTKAVRMMLDRKLDNLEQLDQDALGRALGTYQVLKEIASEEKLDGLAVRCWPEFFEDLQCAACGAISLLSDEKLPSSCEADLNGALSQLILHWLSAGPAFNTDMVTADVQADEIVLWHCGQAPLAMADPNATPQAVVHSNRGVPFMFNFPLKPGKVTFTRLSRFKDGLRLVVGAGQVLPARPGFTGTYGVVRMDHPAAQVLDTVLQQGLEHHLALTYGEHLSALHKLAEMLKLPLLVL